MERHLLQQFPGDALVRGIILGQEHTQARERSAVVLINYRAGIFLGRCLPKSREKDIP